MNSSTWQMAKEKQCFRYVVPFLYNGAFDEAVKLTDGNITNINGEFSWDNSSVPTWKRCNEGDSKSESDLYKYIRNEFLSEEGMDPDNKSGLSWSYDGRKENRKKGSIKKLCSFIGEVSVTSDELQVSEGTEAVFFNICNAGLYLFRNGCGFLWYELRFENDFDTELWLTLQNRLKELNRAGAKPNAFIWECIPGDKAPEIDEYCKYGELFIKPFSFGEWVFDMLKAYPDISFPASRKSHYRGMVKALQKAKGIKAGKEQPEEEMPKEEMSAKAATEKAVPDKAILFTYAVLEGGDTVGRDEMVYHLTYGYTDRYHMSSDTAALMYHPFDGAYWYAVKEGASYVVFPEDDNREVFSSLIPMKVKTDYFALFIKVLYQSYSLYRYASDINQRINAGGTSQWGDKEKDELSRICDEVNIFLTKSMATSVSHIHHQNSFFLYLKERISIREDIDSVTAGLVSVNALLEEQRRHQEILNKEAEREARRQEREAQRREQEEQYRMEQEKEQQRSDMIGAILGLFALLGIASALLDSFDLIKNYNLGQWFNMWADGRYFAGVWLGFVIVISIIAFIVTIVNIVNVIQKWKNRDKTSRKGEK